MYENICESPLCAHPVTNDFSNSFSKRNTPWIEKNSMYAVSPLCRKEEDCRKNWMKLMHVAIVITSVSAYRHYCLFLLFVILLITSADKEAMKELMLSPQ